MTGKRIDGSEFGRTGRRWPDRDVVPVSVRGPLITATILSLAVVSAWSYIASLAIGPR